MFFSLIDSYNRRNDINEYGFSSKMSLDVFKVLKKYKWYKEVRKWSIKSKLAIAVNVAIPVTFVFLFLFLLKPLLELKIFYEFDKNTHVLKDTYIIYRGMWNVNIHGQINGVSAMIAPLIITFISLTILPIGFVSQSVLLNQRRFKKYFFFEEYQKIYKPNKFFNTATYFKSPLFYLNLLLVIIIEGGCCFLLFVAFEKPNFNLNDPNSYILKYIVGDKPSEQWINVIDTNSLLYKYTYHFKPWLPVIIVSVIVIISIVVLFFDTYFFLKHLNASENAKMLKISDIEFLRKQGVTEFDINKIKINLNQLEK